MPLCKQAHGPLVSLEAYWLVVEGLVTVRVAQYRGKVEHMVYPCLFEVMMTKGHVTEESHVTVESSM